MPIDPSRVDDFDPEKVPTAAQLLGELDSAMTSEGDRRSGKCLDLLTRVGTKLSCRLGEDFAEAIR